MSKTFRCIDFWDLFTATRLMRSGDCAFKFVHGCVQVYLVYTSEPDLFT